MTFNPRAQLEKHGWKGSRLGRNEDGMKDAIKVNIKTDHAGVGHDKGEEFTYHWWDHVFNQAANNIHVTDDQNGIKLKTHGAMEIRNKKRHATNHIASKSLLYGHFVKSATLTNDGHEIKEVNSDDEAAANAADTARIQKETSISKLSDDELFKKCGGLTGHKAARHGHGLSGKLARIARQEELECASTVGSSSVASIPVPLPESSKSDQNFTTGKKRKKKDRELTESHVDVFPMTPSETAENAAKMSRKKNKKRKSSEEEEIVYVSPVPTNSDENLVADSSVDIKKKKREGSKLECNSSSVADNAEVEKKDVSLDNHAPVDGKVPDDEKWQMKREKRKQKKMKMKKR